MSRYAGSAKWGRQMLRLVSEAKAESLRLTAEEGFLLSRLDGHTPWRLVRDIGGMEPEEADLCVEGWLASGLLEVAGYASEMAESQSRSPSWRFEAVDSKAVPRTVDESLIDSTLDLSQEAQRRILEFECRLSLPPHELLETSPKANAREVKKAYFKLSREFHPDRYFRKKVDHFGPRLDRIFKKILEAHEALASIAEGDPGLRSPSGEAPGADSSPAIVEPLRSSKLEQLRRRMPLPIPDSIRGERRQKAVALARAAERSARLGDHQEAITSLRVAIRFDPSEIKHRRALVDLEAGQALAQAKEWMADSPSVFSGVPPEALGSVLAQLEKGLVQSQRDGSDYFYGAWLALKVGDWEKSQRFAELALEKDPSEARYHTALGRAHKAKGEIGLARRFFQQALKLNPNEAQAKKSLAGLKARGIHAAQEVCNG